MDGSLKSIIYLGEREKSLQHSDGGHKADPELRLLTCAWPDKRVKTRCSPHMAVTDCCNMLGAPKTLDGLGPV